MAYRPFMTPKMERMARLTQVYSLLLLALGIATDAGIAAWGWRNPNLPRFLVLTTVFNVIPGLVLWFLASRMQRVDLWAFIAAATTALVVVLQFLMSAVLVDISMVVFIAALASRLPLMYMLAAYMNAMPEVMDAYRNRRRDWEIMKRAFEPIMPAMPPPPMTTTRRGGNMPGSQKNG